MESIMLALTKSVPDLESVLGRAGLRCVRREAPADAMGYTLFEYAGPIVRVRLTWEKGFWDMRIADTASTLDSWYDVRLFTYLIGEQAQPDMPFAKQVTFLETHWQEITDAWSPSRRTRTVTLLEEAKKKRACTIYMVWPAAILDLDLFLKRMGLACTCRKEARFLYESMALRYADATVALQIDSRHGWRVHFADVARDPDHWYTFDAIRRYVQWPEDKKLSYAQGFEFIKANWRTIAGLFTPENAEGTHQRLREIERAAG